MLIDTKNNYDFTTMDQLGDEWLMLRNPDEGQVELIRGKGLCLYGNTHTLKDEENESYIGIRQRHHKCRVEAELDLGNLQEKDVAGVAVLQSNEYHVRIELSKAADALTAKVILCRQGKDEVINDSRFSINASAQTVTVSAEIANLHLGCKLATDGATTVLAENIDIHELSTEVAGVFVGETLGVYTSAGDEENKSCICLRKFCYEGIE